MVSSLKKMSALLLSLLLGIALWGLAPASTQAQGTFSLLYSFSGSGTDGAKPYANLMQGSNGNFYGTTQDGGANNKGTIFEMTPDGSVTTLYSFGTTSTDGAYPTCGLIQDSSGYLYGTTQDGGANNKGAIWKMALDGTVSLLYSFGTTSTDGNYPYAGLTLGTDGNLYGACPAGGANGYGTIFKITPGGAFTMLHAFTGIDGSSPQGVLIQATDGNFYGTAYGGGANGVGAIFKITSGGAFTLLYSFGATSTDGTFPFANLLQGLDGNFYGTTFQGGVNNFGTVYRITLSGAETVLYAFADTPDGADPLGGLVEDSSGAFYGTTEIGGANGDGTLYKITMAGSESVLHSFAGTDGAFPHGSLLAADGALFGLTAGGGANAVGTVCKYALNTTPVPVLSKIVPAAVDAGGPAFTLKVEGKDFVNSSVVYWGSTALTTTYVSSTQLTASVPSNLTAAPASVKITVQTPAPGGGVSSAKTFKILQTSLSLRLNSIVKNSDGSYTANLSLKNIGSLSANNLQITKSALGAAATSTTLPVSLGNLAAGSSVSTSLSFPASAGTSGSTVKLNVDSKFTGGTSVNTLKVKLP